jgi:hypothetical protein
MSETIIKTIIEIILKEMLDINVIKYPSAHTIDMFHSFRKTSPHFFWGLPSFGFIQLHSLLAWTI